MSCNGDLYERTHEKFGIAPVPETLRVRLSMEPYNETAATLFKLNRSDDWLRRRQGLALPVQPPTTPEARKYFFTKLQAYAGQASANGRGKINYEEFAREWNQSADGKYRSYITTELLVAYVKTWQKNSNIRASQELIAEKLTLVRQTREIFMAPTLPFPAFVAANDFASSIQPSQGVLGLDIAERIPASLSTDSSVLGSLPVYRSPVLPAVAWQSTLASTTVSTAHDPQPESPEPPASSTDILLVEPAVSFESSFDALQHPLGSEAEPQLAAAAMPPESSVEEEYVLTFSAPIW
ncbi:hypothetical protein C8R47DRAFT_1227219 [Mycena vitilis]|nr:hypothetical protein C8R47DRAFT_1227219 [Mycena vitilis]